MVVTLQGPAIARTFQHHLASPVPAYVGHRAKRAAVVARYDDWNIAQPCGEEIARSPHLRRLTRLILSNNLMGPEGGQALADAPWLRSEVLHPIRAAVEYGRVFQHYEDFTRGVVDLRQLLFYVSGATLALIFSILSIEARVLHH